MNTILKILAAVLAVWIFMLARETMLGSVAYQRYEARDQIKAREVAAFEQAKAALVRCGLNPAAAATGDMSKAQYDECMDKEF